MSRGAQGEPCVAPDAGIRPRASAEKRVAGSCGGVGGKGPTPGRGAGREGSVALPARQLRHRMNRRQRGEGGGHSHSGAHGPLRREVCRASGPAWPPLVLGDGFTF